MGIEKIMEVSYPFNDLKICISLINWFLFTFLISVVITLFFLDLPPGLLQLLVDQGTFHGI